MQAVIAALLLLTCFTGLAGAGSDPEWQLIRPGVQYAVWPVVSAYGSPSVHLLRLNLKQVNLRPLPVADFGAAMPVEEFARYNLGVVAVVNANFFSTRHEKTVPMGLVVQDGRILNPPIRSQAWGIFLIDARGARIVRPVEYRHSKAVRLALQGMPNLLEHGRILKLKAQIAQRTAVGIRPDKTVVLLISRQGSRLSLGDLARAMRELGCISALNFDGGASTQLWMKKPGGEVLLERGFNKVPVALGVFVKEKSPK
ncbi:MAG TPA: phosphodiester glycosidase family protein [Acidobacteriota bacterium]